ncbi:hypothetical protein H5410_045359 [Solanum commersonii]|uniref:Uncharacterized protein n=1 Tax=Solanum commersonii TaxID=4109 RepID=A0A9J5XBD8_SOLCO|nr:hypothetical protein H5410_045359 [Solanum commersonii]
MAMKKGRFWLSDQKFCLIVEKVLFYGMMGYFQFTTNEWALILEQPHQPLSQVSPTQAGALGRIADKFI